VLSSRHVDRATQISAKDKPLRRKVALAYRTAREAGKSHDRAFDAAMTVYLEARPDEMLRSRLKPRSRCAKRLLNELSKVAFSELFTVVSVSM